MQHPVRVHRPTPEGHNCWHWGSVLHGKHGRHVASGVGERGTSTLTAGTSSRASTLGAAGASVTGDTASAAVSSTIGGWVIGGAEAAPALTATRSRIRSGIREIRGLRSMGDSLIVSFFTKIPLRWTPIKTDDPQRRPVRVVATSTCSYTSADRSSQPIEGRGSCSGALPGTYRPNSSGQCLIAVVSGSEAAWPRPQMLASVIPQETSSTSSSTAGSRPAAR